MQSRRDHDDIDAFGDCPPSHAPPSYASTRLQPPPYKPTYEAVTDPASNSSSNSNSTPNQNLGSSPNTSTQNALPISSPGHPSPAGSALTPPPPSYHPLNPQVTITSPPSPNQQPPSYTIHQQALTSISPTLTRSYTSTFSSINRTISRKGQGPKGYQVRELETTPSWCGSCIWPAPLETDPRSVNEDGSIRERDNWSHGWGSWNGQYAFYMF